MLVPLLASVAAAVPPPPPPPPVELWRGALAGMNPTQVQVLFPGGRLPGAPLVATATPNMVEGGAVAGYVAEQQVFGQPATATFYFQGGRLLEVVVDVQNLGLRRTRDNVAVAREIQTGLTNYYGPPKACVDTDRKGLARLDCRWTVKSLQVGLSYVDYGGMSPSLTVASRPIPPKRKVGPAIFTLHGR